MQRWLLGAWALACPWLAAGQVAALQLQVVEGEGAVHAAGSRNLRPLAVQVTDETGRPVPGAAVSFTLPEDGPSGTFASGLRTEIVMADARGRAALRSFQVNRIPGRFQIRITASKEQTRAGMVSFQYIAGPVAGKPATVSKSNGSRKLLVTALVAGAAGIGVALAAGGHGSGGSAVNPVPSAAPLPPSLTIGTPTITVNRP